MEIFTDKQINISSKYEQVQKNSKFRPFSNLKPDIHACMILMEQKM